MNLFTQHIIIGGTYVCHTPWTNEMGYKWKTGEKVVVEVCGNYSVRVRIPKDKQHFDMLLEKFIDNFKIE